MDEELPQATGTASGCLYLLGLALVACTLLFINGGMVLAVFRGLADSLPDQFSNQRMVQFVLFVAPVVLLVLQWMAWDFLVRVFRRR